MQYYIHMHTDSDRGPQMPPMTSMLHRARLAILGEPATDTPSYPMFVSDSHLQIIYSLGL